MYFCNLKFEVWRPQNNVSPPNPIKDHTNGPFPAVVAVDEKDHIFPHKQYEQRLQKLERAYEELSNKPTDIPPEKEKMLMESLDRIKSVEFDLEKTKRVCI